jgi:hypothetical protein
MRLLDADLRGPLADPVVTLRAGKLHLADGRLDAADDLLAGTMHLVDPDALHRRPAAVLTIARLAARPELNLDDAARAATRDALHGGALVRARQSDVWFVLPDLLASPEAIEALEFLRDLSAPHPVHEGAEIDGDVLRRADHLRRGAGSRPLTLLLAVLRNATRRQVRDFVKLGIDIDFAGPEARAVIAAAGPTRYPRWA